MDWNAEQYLKFENERNRPVLDLLAQVTTKPVTSALDVGCGPGNSTQLLQQHYPGAQIIGIDSSADMIDAARKRMPGTTFELADLNNWQPDNTFDLILANAVLQWVPHHEVIFPGLLQQLNPGGTLAVQMPDNFNEPTHCLMRQIAANGPWAARLQPAIHRLDRETPAWYYDLLNPETAALNIWRTTYYHILKGGISAIVEWVKGTGLRPYIDLLTPAERPLFLSQYQEALGQAYTVHTDGSVLLPFPRLFIVAVRA